MANFFTSDIHFGHKNVIDYCNRPYNNVQEMDESIINQWNSQVSPEDHVYFIGDFGINKQKALDRVIFDRLNGNKHIILGNHDYGFSRMHMNKNIESITNKYLKLGWKSVQTVKYLHLKGGYEVVLTHLPPSNEHDSRYSDYKLKYNPAFYYIHGHLHAHYLKKDNLIDVGFDGNLKLYSEDDIISLLQDKREFIPSRISDHYKKSVIHPFLSSFEEEVKNKMIRKVEDDDLVLYNYTEHCTFERHWNEFTLAARGIIFEKRTGKLIALPFGKFFNLGEMPETRLENLPKENYTVTEKMDGSLGIIFNYNGKWRVATRGSLSSEQAKRAEQILTKYDMSEIPTNFTILAEIIYPENKIVVNYGDEEKLVVLGAYDRDKLEELSRTQLEIIRMYSGLPLVNVYNYTIEEMIDLQKTLPKDKEGFVVRFDNGLRVKLKGDEYFRIHKMISNMTPLAFWETMKNGKVNIEYVKELPEEYRDEAEMLIMTLELAYQKISIEISEEIKEWFSWSYFTQKPINKDECREVGLLLKQLKGKLKHESAIFPYFLNKEQAIDKYIMKQIRPNGNVIGDL